MAAKKLTWRIIMNCTKIDEAIAAFALEAAANGRLVSKTPYGNGHINDTFLVRCQTADNTEKDISCSG